MAAVVTAAVLIVGEVTLALLMAAEAALLTPALVAVGFEPAVIPVPEAWALAAASEVRRPVHSKSMGPQIKTRAQTQKTATGARVSADAGLIAGAPGRSHGKLIAKIGSLPVTSSTSKHFFLVGPQVTDYLRGAAATSKRIPEAEHRRVRVEISRQGRTEERVLLTIIVIIPPGDQ